MKTIITTETIMRACARVAANPRAYAVRAVANFNRTNTPGRKTQARLAAGRDALAEALFELEPGLKGNFQTLTKAIRAGLGNDANFDSINELGAVALGL